MNTQLSNPMNYNVSNLRFSKLITSKIGAKRVTLSTKYPDGSEGELIFMTDKLFSFSGVSPNLKQGSDEITGYTLPLSLVNKYGPSDNEKAFIEIIEAVTEACKDHIMANKKELKMPGIEKTDMRKLSPIYRTIDENTGGTVPNSERIYAKLIVNKTKNDTNPEKFDISGFKTELFDEITGVVYNPLDLVGRQLHARAAIKIESLFFGSRISMQVKVVEASVMLVEKGLPRLLQRPKMVIMPAQQPEVQSVNPLHIGSTEVVNLDEVEDKEVVNFEEVVEDKIDTLETSSLIMEEEDDLELSPPPKMVSKPMKQVKTVASKTLKKK